MTVSIETTGKLELCRNCKRYVKTITLVEIKKLFFGYEKEKWCNDCISRHNKKMEERID